MASEFLADIEGKLEELIEPHHPSKLSRYDSYILELTQYIVTLNDQTLAKIQSHRHPSNLWFCSITARLFIIWKPQINQWDQWEHVKIFLLKKSCLC